MKHFLVRSGLSILALLFSISIQAQVKDGFSRLRKGDCEAAYRIFETAYEEETDQWGARWGRIRVLGDPACSRHDYLQAYLLADSIAAGLKKLRNADLKKELADRFELDIPAINEFKKALADSAWQEIAPRRQLRPVDSFLNIVKKPKRNIAVAALKLRETLRREAAAGWTRYADLQYLYADTAHYAWLRDSMRGQLHRIEIALLPAFYDSGRKVSDIGTFFDELRQHPLSRHAAAPAFRAAAASGRLKNLLAFEIAHPRTPFSADARREITRIHREKTPAPRELEALTPEERTLLDDVLGGSVDCFSDFAGADTAAWHNYIAQKAGSNACGKRNFENMLGYYLKKRQWSNASALIKRFSGLFPAEKPRFDEMVALLDAPETGELPEPLSNSINTSKGSEYVPSLTGGGNYLYFCASGRKDNIGMEDIFYSKREGNKWLPAQPLRELSGQGSNEAPLSFTADGNQMIYFYNGKPFVSNRGENGWSAGKPLDLNMNDYEWVGKVQIAPNGRFAIFEARSTGSIDIFIALKNDDDTWQKPFRLDTTINTFADERWPFLHADMKHLYFSSGGRYGFGDLDVFVSTRLDDSWKNWSKPVNLGKMINTPDKDWGYSVAPDGRVAWFSRADQRGEKQDIFYVTLPEQVRAEAPRQVEVLVTDKQSTPLGSAEITAYYAETGDKTGSYSTGAKSARAFFTVENDRNLIFAAFKDGYTPESKQVDFRKLPKDSVARVHIMLDKMKAEGDTVTLSSDVYFASGQWEINPEMRAKLKIPGEFFRKHGFFIELSGHTDHVGDAEDNRVLSEKRAEAVRDLLIAVGVPKEKITAKGYGEEQPVCKGRKDECLAKNRRVEIRWHK